MCVFNELKIVALSTSACRGRCCAALILSTSVFTVQACGSSGTLLTSCLDKLLLYDTPVSPVSNCVRTGVSTPSL